MKFIFLLIGFLLLGCDSETHSEHPVIVIGPYGPSYPVPPEDRQTENTNPDQTEEEDFGEFDEYDEEFEWPEETEQEEGLEEVFIPREAEEDEIPLPPRLEPEASQLPVCPEIQQVANVDQSVKDVVCGFITWGSFVYFHHSGHRSGGGESQHDHGLALDFHISDYSGLSREDILVQWNIDVQVFTHYFLKFYPSTPMGIGIYCDANNPFFHVDLRETRGSWSRLGGRYRDFYECIQYLHKELR